MNKKFVYQVGNNKKKLYAQSQTQPEKCFSTSQYNIARQSCILSGVTKREESISHLLTVKRTSARKEVKKRGHTNSENFILKNYLSTFLCQQFFRCQANAIQGETFLGRFVTELQLFSVSASKFFETFRSQLLNSIVIFLTQEIIII